MAEPTAETVVPRCSWCSAALPAGVGDTCPNCGASLASAGDAAVPGVTAIDPEAVLRGVRAASAPRRNRLLSFITGDVPEEYETTAKPEALAPPPPDVRREILRMEVEAELADLSAEAGAIAADEAVEGRQPGPDAPEPTADGAGAAAGDAGSADVEPSAAGAEPTAAADEPSA